MLSLNYSKHSLAIFFLEVNKRILNLGLSNTSVASGKSWMCTIFQSRYMVWYLKFSRGLGDLCKTEKTRYIFGILWQCSIFLIFQHSEKVLQYSNSFRKFSQRFSNVLFSPTSFLFLDSRSETEASNCSYILIPLSLISFKVEVCLIRYSIF